MSRTLLLGIDIGTSACKTALFTPDGELCAQGSAEYAVYYPQAGWAEQEPEEWWQAACRAVRGMLEKYAVSPEEIAGIGIDGQSWSAIPIGKDGEVLARTPIWFDTRASEICEKLGREIGEEEIFKLCGNPLKPSYSLPKIVWFREQMPEVYQKAVCFLQSNSFIAYRLTGVFSQDRSQGYGLHCFDMKNGSWNEEMCRKMGIRPELLPPIYDCHQIVGRVTAKAAAESGLKEGTPVVAGGLDAACGTLGVGVIHDGETQEQGGQAGGMSICTESYRADPRLILSAHVVPGCWLLQGGTVGGGGVCKWFEQEFAAQERILAQENGTSSFREMDKEAAVIPAGSDGVIFLPYMAGERSPIWDEKAKGVYYGLDFSKTRAHLIRASLEGVALSLMHNLETAKEAGAQAEVLRAMGGAANSSVWTQIKADVTGRKILVPSSDTATTLGAAILAGVGTGVYADFEEAVQRTVSVQREHLPNMENHRIYQKVYSKYLALYQALKPVMAQGEKE
ncbi:MAG: xylulokinase [Candidatus Merdivicinus sp.]|jgi:xylulokinase